MVNTPAVSDRERLAVASNPSASAAALSELTKTRFFQSDEGKQRVLVAVASNPTASADTLHHLFHREGEDNYGTPRATADDREINKALACNPSIRLDTRIALFGMAAYRDLVVASEPRQAPEWRVSRARTASGEEAGLLARNPDPVVRRALALAPRAGEVILKSLLADRDASVATVARARMSTDRLELDTCFASGDPVVLEALLRNPSLFPDLKVVAARASLPSASETTLEIIAKDPSMPSDVLGAVVQRAAGAAQGAAARLKEAVAVNPSASAETLRALAGDDAASIRVLAAKSASTPLDSLVRLAADADEAVREAVARSDSIPLDLLVRLAADADEAVREAVAENLLTPADLLLRLATDEAAAVVVTVARHPNATVTVLDKVVVDQLERRKQFRPTSKFSGDLLGFPAPLVAVAANPLTSHEIQRTLADLVDRAMASMPSDSRDENLIAEGFWVGIADHPSAPADVLERVARAVHKWVWTKTDPHRWCNAREDAREATLSKIVKNPSTSIETLEFLSSGDWVARRTTTRSEREDGHRTTWTIWDGSATAAAKQDMASSVREEISRRKWRDTSDPRKRLAFASNPDAAPDILEELSSDSKVAVRQAVAANSSTGPQTFQRLVGDPFVEVRLAAAAATHPDTASAKHSPNWYSMNSRDSHYGVAFDQLAGDHDATVRAALVGNHEVFWGALSQRSRDQLVFDDDHRVRTELVGAISGREHPFDDFGLSSEALTHLIDTSGPEVWRTLADRGHLTLSIEVLHHLAKTGDTETVVGVVEAYHVDLQLLLLLADSEDAAVVEAVADKDYLGGHDWSMDESLLFTLLRNPLTPGEYLENVAGEWFLKRRTENALSEHSRSEASQPWSAETTEASYEAVVAIIKQLEHDDPFLQLAVAHPNFPEASLIGYATGMDARLVRAALRSGNARALVAAASNPVAPPEILEQLSETKEPHLRRALLENKNTPPDVLVRMIQAGVDSQ